MSASNGSLIAFSYLRRIEHKYKIAIPHAVMVLVGKYVLKFIVLGIGYNECGAMGLGHTNALLKWTPLLGFQQLTSSLKHVFINHKNAFLFTSDKCIYATGNNAFGALGVSFTQNVVPFLRKVEYKKEFIPELVSSTSLKSSFVYSVDHKLWANGRNKAGNFGNGATDDENIQLFAPISTDFLVNQKEEHIIDIKCRNYRSMFLSNTGNVYFCGTNYYGQCSLPNEQFKCIPTIIHYSSINGKKIIQTAMGVTHTLLLDETNRVHCFGLNYLGQFGIKQSAHIFTPMIQPYFMERMIKITSINALKNASLFVDENGNGYTCGSNQFGQVGNGHTKGYCDSIHRLALDSNVSIVDASCGNFHSVLLTNHNNIITFGSNKFSQCTTTTEEEIHTPHTVSKTRELKLLETQYIQKAFATYEGTIIFVNPYQIHHSDK
eukprot:10193_1